MEKGETCITVITYKSQFELACTKTKKLSKQIFKNKMMSISKFEGVLVTRIFNENSVL